MKYLKPIAVAAIVITTLLQILWFVIWTRHYGRVLTTSTFFLTFFAIFYLMRSQIGAYAWYVRLPLGALVGFVAGIVTGVAADFGMRGMDVFARNYELTSYFFTPALLWMGWVYGAFLFALAPAALPSVFIPSRTNANDDGR